MKFKGLLSGIRSSTSNALTSYASQPDPIKQKRTLDHSAELMLLGLFVVFFSLVASKVPPSGDDWTWGSSIGVDRFQDGFVSYNGRYVGNAIVLAMTRLGWLTPILQALGFALIVTLVLDVTRNRTTMAYVTLFALIFLMPAPLWKQSAVWVPGYANFAVGTIAILVFLRSALRELSSDQTTQSTPVGLGSIFAFAIVSQLISEHVTIYLLLSSLVALGVGRALQKRFNPRLLSWTGGFVVGAILMFSSPAYRTIASGGKSYKEMGTQDGSLIFPLIKALRDQISTNGVISNRVLILTIALLVIITAFTKLNMSRKPSAEKRLWIAAAFLGIAAASAVALKMTLVTPENGGSTRTMLAMAGALALASMITLLLTDPGDQLIVFVSVSSIVLLNTPLLFVRPISARTFLPSFILFLMIVSALISNLNNIAATRTIIASSAVAACAGVFGWCHLFGIYSDIESVSTARMTSVNEQIENGASEVTMKRLPHDAWVQRPEPFGPAWMKAFKLYYDLPPDLVISITD